MRTSHCRLSTTGPTAGPICTSPHPHLPPSAPAQHHKQGCAQHQGVAQQHPALLQQPPAVLVVRICAAPLSQPLRRPAQQRIEGKARRDDGQEQPGEEGSEGAPAVNRAVRRGGNGRHSPPPAQALREAAPRAAGSGIEWDLALGSCTRELASLALHAAPHSLADRPGLEDDGSPVLC